jgi:DNA-binding transcriptional ArsR family regulator
MNALSAADMDALKTKVPELAELLRLMATPTRLLLLCQLSLGEASVGMLEQAVGIRQPALSQQLAELRQHKLVSTRRQSRSIFYRIADERVRQLLVAMHVAFCGGTMRHGAANVESSAAHEQGVARFARVTRLS